ncbi:hypothetical protein [Desulfosarcina ovata]|uniref:Uncharacterized protein n=1 Tax=Desulfosarcina ovata subsp. ovata TaxID=2752305 RepID=A0A5K8AGE8_9BACT|nr:hypothetical protein [Desulfosarcina ovata]BBO91763.1 hypothetical protein DSCOOX_49430 [Desulfosarcina ovata subsp. ovata]
MKSKRILLVTFFIFLLSPTYVWAGGGPLLLLFNSSVFIIGQLWIVGVEFLIYRRFINVSKKEAFVDVFKANILSTIAIAFGLPLIVVIAGLFGSFLPGKIGGILSAIGTWVYENGQYNKLAVYMSFFWFVLLFVVTVYFEAWIYKRRWSRRGFVYSVYPTTLCWYANAVSHTGLFVAILAIWHELI